ncbi:hypothetical protein M3M38_05470 [Fructilactobacillus cliffordii]|uniref:sigma factor n=1 Tax=Fructilactobacillus cliffordii TaxID=2940299 RepID=UPI0020930992|nr:sigma factor [Fructilactobacillus cliffordii]USS86146.1 hypothetical protein M3M38_05470 [Fructilactobacillus cliffordii]
METTTTQQGFDFLLEGDHEVVIYGVLKRLNVRPFHTYYHDLVQEGRLAFVSAYEKYLHERSNQKQMLGYIYQSVKWKLLDVLRKQQRDTTKIVEGLEDLLSSL